jgi:titin
MIPPKLHFNKFDDDAFTLRPKETLKIEIPYDGRPTPTVDFKKDGRSIISSTHIQTDDQDNVATLTVFDIRPQDSGTYTIKAENEAGIDKVDIVVEVQGLPDAPRNFKASDVTPETCMLNWDRPLDDGGNTILRYNIERRGFGRKTWQKVGTTRETQFEAENLLEDQTYEFRVAAENIVGEGEGAELQEPVVARYTFGKFETKN